MPILAQSGCLILLAGLYVLFVGTLSAHEALAGAFAVFIAGLFTGAAHRVARRQFAYRPPWRVFAHTLQALVVESILIGRSLLRALRTPQMGFVAQLGFHRGQDSKPDNGRRAIVICAASLAPNGYVIRQHSSSDYLLVHRLVPVANPPDQDWPV